MSGRYVDMDMSGFKEFFNRMERAAKGDFRKELETFLEGLGNEFLRILQECMENRGRRPGTRGRDERKLCSIRKRRPLDKHQRRGAPFHTG